MHHIILDSETDFDGWRKAARALALNGVKPADVTWSRARCRARTVRGRSATSAAGAADGTFNVPPNLSSSRRSRSCIATASVLPCSIACSGGCSPITICSTSRPIRTWRASADGQGRAPRRAQDARLCPLPRGRPRAEARYVAWFEPEHHIVELAAPFFARRFADMPWSILTPDLCAHWDGHARLVHAGRCKAEAPTEDRLEETWRRYYASIFNPARLKVKAMQTEMPKKYWRNLPEASID